MFYRITTTKNFLFQDLYKETKIRKPSNVGFSGAQAGLNGLGIDFVCLRLVTGQNQTLQKHVYPSP